MLDRSMWKDSDQNPKDVYSLKTMKQKLSCARIATTV